MKNRTASRRRGEVTDYVPQTGRGLRVAALVCGLMPIVIGCSSAPDNGHEHEQLGETSQDLFKLTNVPKPGGGTITTQLWPNGIVPICWDSSFTSNASFGKRAAWIMEFLQEHWMYAANVYFEETGACPTDPTKSKGAIRVKYLGEGGGGHAGLGYNPEVYDNQYCAGCGSVEMWFGADKDAYLQGAVLHEFGHALGFYHELERSDFTSANVLTEQTTPWHVQGTQCDAVESTVGLPGTSRTDYSTYDPESIMNFGYCGYRGVLSTKDKSGVASVYGTPGHQQHRTFVRDNNYDLHELRWTGSAWGWRLIGTTDTSTAGSPVTIRSGTQQLVSLFSTTKLSGLLDYYLTTTPWGSTNWTDKQIISNPVAVNYRDYGKGNGKWAEAPIKVRVFATDGSGVIARHYDGTNWVWESYGRPGGQGVQAVGGAVSFRDWGLTEESQYVFVRGANNKLYLLWGTSGAPTAWTGEISATRGAAPGAALTFLSSWSNAREIWYFTTDNGSLWSYRWNGLTWAWTNHGNNGGVNVSGAVAAVTWTEQGIRKVAAYVVDANGRLQQLAINDPSAAGAWTNFGKPAAVASVEGPSATAARYPSTVGSPWELTGSITARSIYTRGSDGKLYWFSTSSGSWYDMTTNYSGPIIRTSLYPSTSSITFFGKYSG